jgi:hypothetical protein
MTDYLTTVGAIIGGTLIPAYLALYIVPRLKPIQTAVLAAAGVGLTFWFFYDTMGDAAAIGVNSAIYPFSAFGGISHFALIVVFILGIAALAIFDNYAVPNSKFEDGQMPVSGMKSKSLILIPITVAAVMGIHGLGEGWDFGSFSASLPATSGSLVDAFGGWNAVISYPLHKFFEASIIAIVYTCYVGRSELAKKSSWNIPLLGLLFGLTSVVGSALGYYFSIDTTYFYGFGVTAAFYAAIRLSQALGNKFAVGINAPVHLGTMKFVALAVGFFLLYTAALFH